MFQTHRSDPTPMAPHTAEFLGTPLTTFPFVLTSLPVALLRWPITPRLLRLPHPSLRRRSRLMRCLIK